MGDEDLYNGYARKYYYTGHIMFPENGGGMQCCMIVFLMVKLNVENVELELLKEERVDYDTM